MGSTLKNVMQSPIPGWPRMPWKHVAQINGGGLQAFWEGLEGAKVHCQKQTMVALICG